MQCWTFSASQIFVTLLTLANIAHPAPVQIIEPYIVEFMQNYGFLKRPKDGTLYLYDAEAYFQGIQRMQEFYDIPVSGFVDEATRALLTEPRCGTSDIENETVGRRQKRFVTHGAQWPRTDLKYFIKSHTRDLPKSEVEKGIETAIQKWASVSALNFRRAKSEGQADITFLWATRAHGDVSAFDGPGGALAHAFYPDAGGDVHMDDDENWTNVIDTSKHNLIQVVTHELGHALGLRHSRDKDSMMYAYINRHKVKLDLGIDDIDGIQEIYGANTNQANAPIPTTVSAKATGSSVTRKLTFNPFARQGRKVTSEVTTTTEVTAEKNAPEVSVTTRPPSRVTTYNPFQQTYNPFLRQKSKNPFYCNSLDKIDAAIKIDESVYFFWKSMYFKSNGGLEKGYPRMIAADWNPLPDNLDAALQWPEQGTKGAISLFFKGSQLWIFNRYRQFERVTTISSFFYGLLPNDIEAAFVRSDKDGSQTYFIKGDSYYTTKTHDIIGIRGPFPTLQWGFPSGFNAAFTYDNIATYFFIGSGYYASDALEEDVQINFQYYPRRTSQWWLSCL